MPLSHLIKTQFPLETTIMAFTEKLNIEPDLRPVVAMRIMREAGDIKVANDQRISHDGEQLKEDDVHFNAGFMKPDLTKLGLSETQADQAITMLTGAVCKEMGIGRAQSA